MGIAIASGVPAARGLVTAIVGGLIIGSLSGSPRQISGPSAGLAVMVLDLVSTHGLVALGVVVPLMGLIQAVAGLLKLGQMFRAVSPAVINGMLAGIGVLIFGAQFHVMVEDAPRTTGLANLLSIPEAVAKGVWPFDWSVHQQAAVIGLITLAVLVILSFLQNTKWGKIPPALAAVGVATIVMLVLDLEIRRVDMPASFFEALAFPATESLALLRNPWVIVSAVALAFVASAETLLCSSAVDCMHDGDRTDYDRELFAQGVGNMACGLLGAPPTTGVITRSTANVQAGASGRQSAIMVGAMLLAFMVVFPTVLEIVPRASLAAILVYIGFNLVKNRPYAELNRYGKSELVIYAITIAVIVGVNLLTGILTGIVLALLKLAISHGKDFHEFELRIEEDEPQNRTHVHLEGAASFMRLPKLAAALEGLTTEHEVHLHVENLRFIDHACLDIITRWERQRIKARAPVRVEWNYLHHKYHASNWLDRTPEEHANEPQVNRRLLDFLTPEVVLIEPELASPQDAIDKLGRYLVRAHGLSVDGDALIDSAQRRERDATTCVGGGLMMPHGVLRSRKRQLGAMALSKKGWRFDTPDGMPVHCIVLLATPSDAAAQHLAVLASLARLFVRKPELRDALIASRTGEAALEILQSPEAAEFNYRFERISDAPGNPAG